MFRIPLCAAALAVLLVAVDAAAQVAGEGAAPSEAVQAAPPPQEPPAPLPPKPFALGFWGALPFGEHYATAITPAEAPYQINEPDTSWAFGLVIDYAVTPGLHAFFDGGMYRQSVEVASEGGTSGSFWVYEQTGYTTHSIGPFEHGARYFMDTTAMRLGVRYGVLLGSLEAWAGLTYGAYRWTATYGTPDRSRKYGQDTGVVTGLTYIGGVDWPISPAFKVGFFADLASPAADIVIEDLFNSGWTYETGHHVMGPYRFGVRVLMPM